MTRRALLVLLLIAGGAARADEGLRWGDVGLYGPASLLDGPWAGSFDFAIVQAHPNPEAIAKLDDSLRRAEALGVTVILDIDFTRKGDESKQPAPKLLDTYLERFRVVLDGIDRGRVHAVTIGEENLPWKGGARVLATLYDRLKERYPETRFYQWYSPTSRRLNVPGQQWPELPADGWVIDHYLLQGEAYERLVAGWTALGKPVVNLVWLSPDWQVGHRRDPDPEWWERAGWRQFHHQLAVSRAHDLPVGFFMYRLPDRALGERRLRFYGEDGNSDATAFMTEVTGGLVPFLRGRPDVPLAVPETRPAWIPGWPVTD
ncbi:MAG: hypothetical protein WD673_15815 [Alphaproteobacteria bacterium]